MLETCLNMTEILWEIELNILLEYMLMYLLFVFLGKIDNSKRVLGISPTLLTLHTNEDLATKKSIQASWIPNDSEVVELVVQH